MALTVVSFSERVLLWTKEEESTQILCESRFLKVQIMPKDHPEQLFVSGGDSSVLPKWCVRAAASTLKRTGTLACAEASREGVIWKKLCWLMATQRSRVIITEMIHWKGEPQLRSLLSEENSAEQNAGQFYLDCQVHLLSFSQHCKCVISQRT